MMHKNKNFNKKLKPEFSCQEFKFTKQAFGFSKPKKYASK